MCLYEVISLLAQSTFFRLTSSSGNPWLMLAHPGPRLIIRVLLSSVDVGLKLWAKVIYLAKASPRFLWFRNIRLSLVHGNGSVYQVLPLPLWAIVCQVLPSYRMDDLSKCGREKMWLRQDCIVEVVQWVEFFGPFHFDRPLSDFGLAVGLIDVMKSCQCKMAHATW